ncbi:MAG: NFACT family protein, partial [Candidatus Micrarchaeota archaeon]|nr:NFACT family protein [Candidatus Micrarchaeota archaeon]
KGLQNGFFNKASWQGNNVFRLKFNKGAMTIDLGKYVIAEKIEEEAKEHPFSETLRNILYNSLMEEIETINQDRVIRMKFRQRGTLYVEMYGKAKAVLVGEDGNIAAYFVKDGKEKLENKTKYKIPETMPLDGKIYLEQFKGKPIGAVMARMLGKIYSKWILEKEGMKETETDYDAKKLDEIIGKYLDQLGAFTNREKNDFAALPIFEENEKRSSISEAVKFCIENEIKENPELEKLKRSRERMIEAIEGYKKKADESRKIAEAIYENYEKIEETLEKAKKGEIEGVNRKEKTIEIEI